MTSFWSNDPEFKNWDEYLADDQTLHNPDKNKDAVDSARASTRIDIGQWCAGKEGLGTPVPFKEAAAYRNRECHHRES